MTLHIAHIIVLLGSFQGFLLAFVFVASKKFTRKSNLYLALVLFSISLVNVRNGLGDVGYLEHTHILTYLPTYWLFAIPVGLRFAIRYLIRPDYQIGKWEHVLWLPFGIHILYQLARMVAWIVNEEWLHQHWETWSALSFGFEAVGMIFCLILLVQIYRELTSYETQLMNQYSEIESRSLAWLKHAILGSLILWTLWAVPFTIQLGIGIPGQWVYYPLYIGQAIIIYWVGYGIYARRDIFEAPELTSPLLPDSIPEPTISSRAEGHYQRLLHLMKEEALYTHPDLSMSLLAEKTELSNGYLSQILNQKEGKNFFEFVNAYRVEEVKRRLTDPAYSHYSLLAIGMDAGFKSKSTFYSVFKRMTGKTPAAYKDSLQ